MVKLFSSLDNYIQFLIQLKFLAGFGFLSKVEFRT